MSDVNGNDFQFGQIMVVIIGVEVILENNQILREDSLDWVFVDFRVLLIFQVFERYCKDNNYVYK